MATVSPRTRAWLFFVALALPCAGLVALGLRMVADGDSSAINRQTEVRQQLLLRIGSDLAGVLERIRTDVATAQDTARPSGKPVLPESRRAEVALVAWVQQNQLQLPWENDPAARQFANMLRDNVTPFGQARAFAERQETLVSFAAALREARRAREVASTSIETDYASLLEARIWLRCNCAEDAKGRYLALLKSETRDDEGVPLALYAAQQLIDLNAFDEKALALVESWSAAPGMAPPAAHLLAGIVRSLSALPVIDRDRASRLLKRAEQRIVDINRAATLKRAFGPMALVESASANPSIWFPFDSGAWLVAVSRSVTTTPSMLIAVRSSSVADAISTAVAAAGLAPGSLRLSTNPSSGVVLGEAFPGLFVQFESASSALIASNWRRQKSFYLIALSAVVAVTMIGGFVLWRDVRRELRLAEMRSQFVASVSHELKTPLTAIRMFAETLQMDRPLGAAAKSEYLDTIVSESERLTRLINNVLDYSKIERGQKVYHFEPISLDSVVRKAAQAMRYPLERQGFELRVDMDGAPQASIDEDAIEQALLNLLSNAMKYSRDRRQIDLKLTGTRGHAVIEVTDYGLGISPEEQPRIFERFYRVAVPENAGIAGAGLGLALVDHIVKAHGGTIDVRSAPGQGSTFAIALPVLSGPATPPLEVAS